ncbi:hypothetical protein JCM1840_000544 [Sporobolomyces johnsonii]
MSASVLAAAQKDDFEWAQPVVDIEQTSFYKTYTSADWHAPEDVIILMQHGKCNLVPLSLFTAEAIRLTTPDDETAWDGACNYVRVKSSEILDIQRVGDSLTLHPLAVVLGGLKLGDEMAATSMQDLNHGDQSLSTTTAQKLAEKLADDTRILDGQRIRGTWTPFEFPASLHIYPPQQQGQLQQPTGTCNPLPTSTPLAYHAPTYPMPSSSAPSQQPSLPNYPPLPPPPWSTPSLPSAVLLGTKFCGVCGLLGSQGLHYWGECEDYNGDIFYKMGMALYCRNAPTANVPCDKCPRNYYHICSGCGKYNTHTHLNCPMSPKITVPPSARLRLPGPPYSSYYTPEYPNKRPKLETTEAGASAQEAVFKGETITAVHQMTNDRLDPVNVMHHHLHLNKVGTEDFSSPSWNDPTSFYPLTYSAFTKRVNDILEKAGRHKVNGHSSHIGGSTFYLLAGVNPDIVKKCGNWKLDAFLRYWHNISIIAAQNLIDAPLVDVTVDT